ncbi:hypothetical protein [Egicoccus halophilus]|uniref:hypothetical protein n=1 Tax=Egicoccus halophilus TaxID=1670830 RepID=UPI0010321D42|nr:hypothetical protein [Egicoccus halophilus]
MTEQGSSPIGAVFGVGIFLAFLLLATQTLLHLYATSIVSSATFDAARRAAAEDGLGCDEVPAQVRARLGSHGAAARVTCTDDGEQLHVAVTADSPASLLRVVDARGISRTATVRVERVR